jgi:hypothetical protein
MKKEENNRARDFARKLRDMAEAEGFFAVVSVQEIAPYADEYAAHTSGPTSVHMDLVELAGRTLSKSIEEEEDS